MDLWVVGLRTLRAPRSGLVVVPDGFRPSGLCPMESRVRPSPRGPSPHSCVTSVRYKALGSSEEGGLVGYSSESRVYTDRVGEGDAGRRPSTTRRGPLFKFKVPTVWDVGGLCLP